MSISSKQYQIVELRHNTKEDTNFFGITHAHMMSLIARSVFCFSYLKCEQWKTNEIVTEGINKIKNKNLWWKILPTDEHK